MPKKAKAVAADTTDWASRPDKGRGRQGLVGTFSKPLLPPTVGDPYDHKALPSKDHPLYQTKKDGSAAVFNPAKDHGKRLGVLGEPHDKWTSNGPLRGFTPFKPLGGPGGSVPKPVKDKTDKKWETKMQRSPNKFFGSSDSASRAENTHNIKQQRMAAAIQKEEYNLRKLMKMQAEAKLAAKENQTPTRASTRASSRSSMLRSEMMRRGGTTGGHLRKRASTVQGGELKPIDRGGVLCPPCGDKAGATIGGGAVPLHEGDPSDSFYTTKDLTYDNILNPSTRYVDERISSAKDSVCAKCKKDTFFCPHVHDSTRTRRLGSLNNLSSIEIGMGSKATLLSPSPPRRPFSNKPGVAKVFGGDLKTETDMGCRLSPPPRGAMTAYHSDRWK